MSNKTGSKSPIGLRVAASTGDGYFAPGTIMSVKSDNKQEIFVVKFDDNTYRDCFCKDMIGTNFQAVPDVYLQRFQKVYTTHNGREVSGYIQQYHNDQILISIPGGREEKEVILKKPYEIRLLNNRNTAPQRTSPMDYSKSSEESSPVKRRIVSDSIEVPQTVPRVRRTSEEPTMTELMAAMVLSSLSSSPVFHNVDLTKGSSPHSFGSSGVGSWTQDSSHTSPSRQPTAATSPHSSSRLADAYHSSSRKRAHTEQHISNSPEDVLDGDSGMILLQRSTPTPTRTPEKKNEIEVVEEPQDLRIPKVRSEYTASPRPLSHSSQSSSSYSEPGKLEVVMEQEEVKPKMEQQGIPIPLTMPLALSSQIQIPYYFHPGFLQQRYPASLPAEIRIPMVGPPLRPHTPDIGSSAPGHIDSKIHRHLHRAAPYKINDDSSVPSSVAGCSPSTLSYGSAPPSYYPFRTTPIPVSSLSFSPSHHGKHARSPLASKPQAQPRSTSAGHKPHSSAVPVAKPVRGSPYSHSMPVQPISVPTAKPFTWNSGASPNFLPASIIQQRQQLHQAASPKMNFSMSPKSIPIRKVRGDGKKCRKVYGMENRDMWCTACKWKKACQRFPD